MSEVTTVDKKAAELPSPTKEYCDVIDTLESLITAVKPMKKEGYQENTIWMPALTQESQKEVEQKIMEFVRKLK